GPPPPPPAPPPPRPPPRGTAPARPTGQPQHPCAAATPAAERGAAGLSHRAAPAAPGGAPPVPGKMDRNRYGGGPLRQTTINGVQYLVSEGMEGQVSVDQALVTLVPKWRTAGVPAAQMYEVLAGAVLPAARPAEVFLYTDGRTFGMVYRQVSGVWQQVDDPLTETGEDRGLCSVLCELAVEAGKVDDLRARAGTRLGQ